MHGNFSNNSLSLHHLQNCGVVGCRDDGIKLKTASTRLQPEFDVYFDNSASMSRKQREYFENMRGLYEVCLLRMLQRKTMNKIHSQINTEILLGLCSEERMMAGYLSFISVLKKENNNKAIIFLSSFCSSTRTNHIILRIITHKKNDQEYAFRIVIGFCLPLISQ